MPRPKRIYFPGALHHVFNRGNEKKNIFLDNEDRMKFLYILKDCFLKFNFKIYSYILMPNHFHFLLEDTDGKLPYIMKYISENYTMYFNYKYKRVGYLFQGRYKSILVEKIFLKDVVRYIILNPVRAGIVQRLNEYNWSCYYEYLGKNKQFNITTTNWIYEYFDKNKNMAREKFKKFLVSQDGIFSDVINESLFSNILLGSQKFKKELQENLAKITKSKFNLPDKIFRINKINTQQIIKKVAEIFRVNESDLKIKRGKYNYLKKTSIL